MPNVNDNWLLWNKNRTIIHSFTHWSATNDFTEKKIYCTFNCWYEWHVAHTYLRNTPISTLWHSLWHYDYHTYLSSSKKNSHTHTHSRLAKMEINECPECSQINREGTNDSFFCHFSILMIYGSEFGKVELHKKHTQAIIWKRPSEQPTFHPILMKNHLLKIYFVSFEVIEIIKSQAKSTVQY